MQSNSKKRVLHAVTTLELGGAQKNTLYSVDLLDKTKYDVFLLHGPEGVMHDKLSQLKDVRCYQSNNLIRSINPFKDLLCLIDIYKYLKNNKIDIIHTHSSKAGILGRIAAKLAKVPVIVHTAHGWGFHDYQKRLVKAVYVWIERFCAKFTDKIVVVSNETQTKGLIEKVGITSQYIKIHSAIEGDLFRNLSQDQSKVDQVRRSLRSELNIPAEAFVVLKVACFKHQKNHTDFILAAKDVCQKSKNCIFVLAGDGELRAGIEAQIKEFGLENNFRILGWRKDIPELMVMSDLIAMTSLFEGLPQVCLQTLAVGRPMIMYSADGIKEVIDHDKTGVLVEPKNVAAFAKSIIELSSHSDKYEAMKLASQKAWKPEYDVKDMVHKIEALYHDLLEKIELGECHANKTDHAPTSS